MTKTRPQPSSLPRPSKPLTFFTKLLIGLIYLLPAALFCAYYPIIPLGANASMNFELSLPLLWLVIFDIVALMAFISVRIASGPRDFPGLSDRRFFLFSLFPFFATLSIFWSANPLRALLTAGIIWLLFFAVFAIIFLLPLLDLPKTFQKHALAAFFIAGVAACLICWAQCFLDLAGLAREQTLLCRGCTYHLFGFPHPSGLAIEPQFMGNLLLAPTLVSLYLLLNAKPPKSTPLLAAQTLFVTKRARRILLALATLFSATLFLTFSRGAIYAYAVALLILIIFALRRHLFRLALIVIPVATFLGVLLAQGLFSALSPTSETFLSGIDKSLDQLSLGIIDLIPADTSAPESDNAPDQPALEAPDQSAIFDGYVAESTNIRLNLNVVALQTWLKSPQYILIGTGLGAAGTVMHEFYPATVTSPKEIVQNQFVSLLLELGLIGVALAGLGLYLGLLSPWARANLKPQLSKTPTLALLLVPLIIAYLLTLNFFAGLPNALHIYLFPPLLYLIFRATPHHATAQNHTPNKKHPQAAKAQG